MPEAESPGVRGRDVREDLEQARLAGAVQTHDQQALAPGHVEPDALEHRRAAVALGEPLGLEHDRPRPRRLGETVAHEAFTGRRLDDALLEFADAAVERLRLLGALDGLTAHRIRERLQALHLGLLTPGERTQPRLVGAAGRPVLRVGPPILHDAVAVQVQDPGDRAVEQAEIVAHDHERAAVRGEEPHEPVLGVAVEMVRRLVQQQEVRTREQDAGELEAAALPSGESPDRQVQAVVGKTEPGCDPTRFRLAGVAPGRPVSLLEPGEARDVRLARALLHREPELLQALGHLLEPAGLQHMRERGVRMDLPSARLLPEVAEPAADDGSAGERRFVTGDHVEQARLAGPIASHDAGLVAGAQRQGQALEDRGAGDLDGQVGDLEHAHRALRGVGWVERSNMRSSPGRGARDGAPVGAGRAREIDLNSRAECSNEPPPGEPTPARGAPSRP